MADVRYYPARAPTAQYRAIPASYYVLFHGACAGDEAWLSAVVAKWDETDGGAYWACARHRTAWRPEGFLPPSCVCLREVSEYRRQAHLD